MRGKFLSVSSFTTFDHLNHEHVGMDMLTHWVDIRFVNKFQLFSPKGLLTTGVFG